MLGFFVDDVMYTKHGDDHRDIPSPKVGSNLGPNTDKLGPKPCTMTQHKARRTNQITFLPLPWAQEASGSNPDAPTNKFKS
jgi:hypothetical protein